MESVNMALITIEDYSFIIIFPHPSERFKLFKNIKNEKYIFYLNYCILLSPIVTFFCEKFLLKGQEKNGIGT